MRNFVCLLALFLFVQRAQVLAQVVLEKGTVSFVSSQNVYVKFESTKGINIGDTLFFKKAENPLPALLVSNKSSVSCVCSKLIPDTIRVGDEITARTIQAEPKKKDKAKDIGDNKEKDALPPGHPDKSPEQAAKAEDGVAQNKKIPKQKIRARLSASSYTNLSDRGGDRTQMRYSFTMQGDHIKNSRFSTDNYITFRHTLGEWDQVKANFNDALKIYSLSVKYDFTENTNLVLGRRINPKMASMGAIDGAQFEKGFGSFFFGAIAGSRPDMLDYSVNFHLMQGGAYIGHEAKNPNNYQLTTLGVIEQRNKSAVDRRFMYFQHTGDLAKNLNLFGSCEVDLYEKINNESKTKPSLTNLFLSLQYRFSRKLSANISYDSRKNIIYYESYKSYIDKLIEDETRQGLRFGLNYRPFKLISWGMNASWRFQKTNINDSKNLNTYLNVNRVPFLKASVSVTANFLQTSYINSKIYGVKLLKDFFGGKVNGELYYRRVDYDFPVYQYKTNQNIIGGSLSWQILKKLGFYFFVEETLDSQNNNYMLINTKLIQRF